MNMKETRTIRIQLNTTPEQAVLLMQTMQEYTVCFNEVCEYADTHHVSNGVELHKATYLSQRLSSHLPSQLICAARVKATEAIKSVLTRRKKQQVKYQQKLKVAAKKGFTPKPLVLAKTPHSQLCAIRYDARSFLFKREERIVSLVHVQQEGKVRNRTVMSVRVPAYYEQYLTPKWEQESADLIYRQGTFWLHLVVSAHIVPVEATGETVGVDVGMSRLAVTSQPRFFGNKQVKETNNRYFRLRRDLQSKGTRSAKRHLKKLSGRIARFQKNANHVVAKQLVSSVNAGDTLVMENLTDIRERTIQRREKRQQRREHANWSFAQLQSFVAYKAAWKGVTVAFIDPRYTSQGCSKCGFVSRANRKSQSEFSCTRCEYKNNADYNAALNIRTKHLASRARSVASGQTSACLSCPSSDETQAPGF